MAETANISLIANKITGDIFRVFHWEAIPLKDTNFDCVLKEHAKATHPEDVVFYYLDPYLNKRIYLHTDLKSYSKASIQVQKIRNALVSLAESVECAHLSPSWRNKYDVGSDEPYEIRGLLFIANHDGKAKAAFSSYLSKVGRAALPIAQSQVIHVLGPDQISNLYSVATDIKLSIQDKTLSSVYRFFYPDLTLWKRHSVDDQRNGATIETLLSPYFILKHNAITSDAEKNDVLVRAGSLVYYSRAGDTVDEFVYLIDSLSRYQLVNSKEDIRIRVFNQDRSPNLMTNFERAKERYCSTWHFDGEREAEVKAITISAINQLSPNYTPDEIGWREE